MEIGKIGSSIKQILKRPISDAVGYALTALIVVVVWTLGVVLTSLDFDMLSTSYSSDGQPRSIKAAVVMDASIHDATGVKKVKELYSWTSPNGAVTFHYVTARIKGGLYDGFYVVAMVNENIDDKEFFADILNYSRTEEQNKLAADAHVENAKIAEAESENRYGEKLDEDTYVILEYIGEYTSISDFDVEFENEYEIPVGSEWVEAKDTFYFFTLEEYYSSGECVTAYKIVRVTSGGPYDEYHPNLVEVAECATESERDALWDDLLDAYNESMQDAKDAGAWR